MDAVPNLQWKAFRRYATCPRRYEEFMPTDHNSLVIGSLVIFLSLFDSFTCCSCMTIFLGYIYEILCYRRLLQHYRKLRLKQICCWHLFFILTFVAHKVMHRLRKFCDGDWTTFGRTWQNFPHSQRPRDRSIIKTSQQKEQYKIIRYDLKCNWYKRSLIAGLLNALCMERRN